MAESPNKTPNFRGNATYYVDEQIALMRKFGRARILGPKEYYDLVSEIERVTRKLWDDSTANSGRL